tara:strand:+ start:25 stop:198 length:174 start_codon:yes stop_codon:yes gene_type:complete
MIKFEITLPHNDGMKDNEIQNLIDFLEGINYDDLRFLLERSVIKQMRPTKITMKRSK